MSDLFESLKVNLNESTSNPKVELEQPNSSDTLNYKVRVSVDPWAPLADRMRPQTLDEVQGQIDLVGERGFLREMITKDILPSLVFWGPPGSGKTTLARVISNITESRFISLSAVLNGVKDLKESISIAEKNKRHGHKTILFVDEIHRWNKSQQDALLPHIESGLFTLIGATTENPSFELNPALLSRLKVAILKHLTKDQLKIILESALKDIDRGLGSFDLSLENSGFESIVGFSEGDARRALNLLESASLFLGTGGGVINEKLIEKVAQAKIPGYRKKGEQHYDLISAFIKSMRGSDPDAALYYLARMLHCGEDPVFIARRMVIFASEDVSNADPRALQIANDVAQAVQFVGLPECSINLAHGVSYLAAAPKSNASYMGLMNANAEIKKSGELQVPLKVRNAPTTLMKSMGCGRDYKYAHNFENNVVPGESYLPSEIKGSEFYNPTDNGYEKYIKAHLNSLKKNF